MRGSLAFAVLISAGACDTVFRLDRVPALDARAADAPVDVAPDAPSILACSQGSITLRPIAIAAESWDNQFPATGTHLDKISEAVHDDDASYIQTSIDGRLDLYSHTPVDAAATIDSVTVWIRARLETATTSTQVGPALLPSAALNWDDVSITSAWNDYSGRVFVTNPETGKPWTVAELNATTFGVRKAYADYAVRVTQIWATAACH